MMKTIACYLTLFFFACAKNGLAQNSSASLHKAPAPLYRDPVYDGAADPTVVYNKEKKEWWMFYSQRRANQQTANVAFDFWLPEPE